MTTLQRIRSIFIGLLMIGIAGLLIFYGEDGYDVVIFLLSTSLTFSAIRTLIHYFTMARYMVGGKTSLYRGVIMLDFAFVTGTLFDLPSYYILIYLIAIRAFSVVVEFLRANEAGKYGSKSWRGKVINGVVNIVIIIACIRFIDDTNIAVLIYSLGLLYDGVVSIGSAFKKSALVYIQ